MHIHFSFPHIFYNLLLLYTSIIYHLSYTFTVINTVFYTALCTKCVANIGSLVHRYSLIFEFTSQPSGHMLGVSEMLSFEVYMYI